MINFAQGTKVFLYCQPVEHAQGHGWSVGAGEDGHSDGSFFRTPVCVPRQARGLCQILHWDGSGLCLYAKRMEQGAFVWPPILDEQLHLTSAQLALLIEGIDWRRTVAAPESQRPAIV